MRNYNYKKQKSSGFIKVPMLLTVLAIFFANNLFGQISGTIAIPSANYPTIKVAVDSLNLYGVAGGGGVTFNVDAGYTETLTARINMTASGSLADQIVFQKSGAGANPVLTSYVGTNLAIVATMDGMWALAGSDYVTIDGINLTDAAANTTATTTMEYGYGLFKASATDGANNNTIKNCVITLNRVNNTAPTSGPAFQGSNGIALLACTPTTMQTTLTVTATSGASSNNKFYSNTIQNVNCGICMTGFAGTTPFSLCDQNNDIGGASLSTGNTIINFGGGASAANACVGVFVKDQWSFNVSYNTVNNNNGSGVNHAQVMRGIFCNLSSTNASGNINNNTVSIKSGGNFQVSCIENAAGSSGTGNTININNNTISNCTNTTYTTAIWYGIWNNSASPTNLNIQNNTFTNNQTNATTGGTYLIYNTGAVAGNINFTGNNLSQAFVGAVANSAINYFIYNNNGTITSNLNISTNTFSNITSATIGTGTIYFIYNINGCANFTLNANNWSNLTLNYSGTHYVMYNGSSTQVALTVTNNIISNWTRTAAAGTMYMYYGGSSSLGSSTQTFSGNSFTNITATTSGSGSLYLMYNTDGASSPYPRKNIFNNTFQNINYNTTGSVYLSYTSYLGDGGGASGSNIYNNTWDNITTAASTLYGLYPSTTVSPNFAPNIYGNTVSNITSNGITYGCYAGSSAIGVNIFKNKIFNIQTNSAGGTAYGIYTLSVSPYNIYNNTIGDIKAPASTLTAPAPSVAGMYFNSGSPVNAYDNTVYLSAATTSTALNWGSAAVYASTSPLVNLRNNVLVNLSVPKGTGKAAAYERGSNITSTYGATSNNNAFYAGTPSANNVIFYDGTNADQTIMAYKARMFPIDALSGSENPTFLSLVGANANYLHIDPTVATNIESGAVNITGITDDFDSQTRQGNGGYVGTGTAPDIGADEFGGIAATVLAPPINFTSNTNTINSFNITWDDNSVGEAGFVVYRSLSPGGPFNTIVAAVVSTSVATTGTTYTLPQTALLGGATYYYQIVANNFSSSAVLPGSAATLGCGSGLAGTYTIPGVPYASLTDAITALQTNGMSAPVILELDPTYVGAGETYPLSISNLIGCLNLSNTLTIRPAATVASPLIITSNNTTATIDINGANFVTIDGRPGGLGTNKYLIIENTSTTSGSAGNAILMRNEASNNKVTYCEVRSANANSAVNTAVTTAGSISGAIAIGTTTGAFGNDNDTISYCNIHSLTPGGSLGVCIYSGNATAAGSAANNDFNTVDNCNLYDFFLPTLNSAGIVVAVGNSNWTITNNHVYQQSTLNYAAGLPSVRGFWITPNTGSFSAVSGFNISNNYIGGNAANGTGNYTMTGTGNYFFRGMDISVGSGAITSIQNNTITNLNITGGFSGNQVFGIDVNAGNVNIGTSIGNLVGSTTTNGSITVTTTVTGGSFIGLRSGSPSGGAINFSNNTVSGIDMIGSATAIATGFNGIACSGGANITVNNNTVGSATLANSINMVSTSSTSTNPVAVRGIIHNSGATGVINTITNNLIANINTNNNAAGTQASTLIGLSVTTGISTISGNTIRNLTSASQTTATGPNPVVLGINYTSGSIPALISNNTIHSLKATHPTTAAAIQATGIYFSGPSTSTHIIERNFIHSISIASPTNSAGTITGMDLGVTSGATITIKNNMIRLGYDETGASIVSPCTIRGITKNVPNSNIWFNSIYIGGTGVGTTATNTFCIARTSSSIDDWRNNILVNNRSNAATGGKHYSINLNAFNTLTLDYNDYYGSGTGYIMGYTGSADVAGYTLNWVAGDAHSYNGDPIFINPTGTSATVDLHIDPSTATIIEGTGTNIASVTNDYDNQTRSALTPTDMGADAGNFVSLVCSGQPVGGTSAVVQPGNICISGSKTISLSGFTNVPGIALQWQQSSVPGGPYTNVTGGSGATTATYNTAAISAKTYYVCLVTCTNSGLTALSTEALVQVDNPQVVSAPPASRCGAGSVTLCATGSAGTNLNWYNVPTGGLPLSNPYLNIPVTGFNNDIVAGGVGSSSILGITNSFGVDGAGYSFVDNTYKYVSTNALPTCYMPVSKLAPSQMTPGLTYELQDYGVGATLNNNALSIANQSTTYTSPLPSSGTLTLAAPASYANLRVLYESVVYVAPLTVNATVTFTDATTQVFAGNTCQNWFTVSSPAYSGMGRTTPAGVMECGSTPNMFELNLAISPANQSKQVQSITFSIPTVLTSGTTATGVNYFHAMAVGGNKAATPGCYNTPVISSSTNYYVSASVGGTNANVGLIAPPSYYSTTTSIAGIVFDATSAFTLNTVDLYPSAASNGTPGTVTIALQNSAGVTLQSTTVNVTGYVTPLTLSAKNTVYLGFYVPPGTGYRLTRTATTGISALQYECGLGGNCSTNFYSGGYPTTVPGIMTQVCGHLNSTTPYSYYVMYFYNWSISTGCESARTTVPVTVSAPPTLSVTPSQTVCNNVITMMNVTSPTANYDSITWAPVAKLYLDAAATIPYTGGNEDTVYFRSATQSANTFSCTGNNTLPPYCGNIATTTVNVQPTAATITLSQASLCFGGSEVLGLNPASPYAAGSLQWKVSADNSIFNDIAGETNSTYTTPVIDTTTYYSVDVKSSSNGVCFTANATVIVNEPVLLTTTGASSCTPASLTLGATATAGATINWYTTATGGAPVTTGTSYTTPVLNNSTTYYAAATNGGFSANVGKSDFTYYSNSTGITTYGLQFDAVSPFTLSSVVVYPYHATNGTAGNMTIGLANSAGTILQQATVSVIGYNQSVTPNAQTVNLNFSVTAGTGYRLVLLNMSGITGVCYQYSGSSSTLYPYPFTVPNVVSITNSLLSGTSYLYYYYYFYNWSITTGCEGPRTPVVAAISTPPTSIATVTNPTITCTPGQTVTLSVASSNGVLAAGGSWEYQWMDETGTTILQPWSSSSNFNVTAVSGLNKYRIYMRNSACPANTGFDYASFIVGISGSAIGVSPTGCSPTGTIIVSAQGSGVLTNWYSNDFTSATLGTAAAITGAAAIAGGQCLITPNSTSQSGAFQVFNPGSISAANYSIDFDLGVLPSGADGFSYSFGDDVSPTSATPNFECGTGTKFKLTFDAYPNTGGNVPGIYLMYNCNVDLQPPATPGVLAYINNTSWLNANTHVNVVIDPAGFVTVKLNGIPVINNVQLPTAYLTANRSTWTHVFKARTGGIGEMHSIDNLAIKYNAFEYSINGPGGPWQVSNAFNNLPVGAYSVWVRNPADITCTADLGIFNLTYPTSVATNATDTALCISGATTLSMSPLLAGATYQWDSSAVSSSGPWFPITGALSATYLANISATSWYRCNISCGGTPIPGSPSIVRQVAVYNPQVTGVDLSQATRCGLGSVTLGATASAGATINWYTAASGGTPVATGPSYTTPAIATSKNYYASAVTGGSTGNVGMSNFTYYSNTTGITTYGLGFDALKNITINSVVVYPYNATNGTAGTMAIGVANSAGTVLSQTTVNVTGYNQLSTPTPQTVNVNLQVPAGSGYRLVLISYTGITGVCYQYSGSSATPYPFPYTLPGVVSITNALVAGSPYNYYYYYFYNWSVSSGCESGRTPVPATVTAPPAVTINASATTICSGNSTTLTASCLSNPNYTYEWTPGFIPGASVSVNPAVTTKYTVTATDNSAGTNFGCVDTETVTINVNASPQVPVITSTPSIVCSGSPVTLTASSVQPGIAQIGTGTSTNGSIGQSPFSGNYEGSKIQYLITAAELNAANVYAGQITSVAFNVTTIGVSYAMNAYSMKIGATSATSLTGYQTGLTQVYQAVSTTQPVAGWNTFTFSSPFNWNGSSNIVIEVCHNNDPVGACSACYGGTATVQSTTTSATTVYGQYGDNTAPVNPWDLCSQINTGNVTSSANRPNIQLGYGASTTFLWSTGATTASISNTPSAGSATYTVTVSNTLGCTKTASTVILTSPSPHPYMQEGDSVLCSNDAGFYMHVLDNGAYAGGYPAGTMFDFYGAGSILYQSSTDNSYFNANNSDAFYAVVTLPGYLGSCTAMSDTSVMDFGNAQAPQYMLSTDSIKCYGGATGDAIVDVIFGGTSDFRYQWYDSGMNNLLRDVTKPGTNDSLKNVPAGMYIVVITDHQGATVSPYCSVMDSVYVGEPAAPLAVTENIDNHVNVLCNGALTGVIDINVTGGTEPYSYNWSNSTTSEDLTGTGVGTYTCTVTDSRGCTVVITGSLTEPTAIVISSTVNQIQCNGGTGSVAINVTGGVGSYSYDWSNSSFASGSTGLTSGTYTVTVTDGNGCTMSETFIINTEPTAVTANCNATPVSCFGGSNGTVGVTGDGGSSGYTYSWSNGSTATSQSTLTKGIYTVVVTDAHGCTASCSASVTQPVILAVTTASVNPTSGLPNSGTINVNSTGGTTAYSYQWNNGSTAQNRTGLSAGTYTVTVTDANGCSASRNVTLTYTCQLGYINSVVTRPSCGKPNGVATVAGTGGTGYTYAWQTTPVQTTATATGLSYYYNSYCLITDVTTGCSFMDTVVLPTSNGLNLVLTSPTYAGGYNIRCNGGSTGNISLTVTGSTGPYTYLWNNGVTTQNLTNVPAGTYMVTVSNGGCTNSNLITLTQPAAMVATATGVNPGCFGGNNGTATATAGGGASPYTYSWNTSPVKTSATATGLTAGVYIVTVSDANGCTKTALVALTQPATGVTVSGVVTNVNCNGGTTGSIDITPSGGSPAYTYLWTGGATTQDRINALAAGTYTVTVTDSKGCTTQYSNTITQPTAITATATTTNVNCNGGSNGTGSVTASGGTPPYTYSWNTVPPKSGANVNGIKKGTYTVIITDSKGCVKAITVNITEPTAITIAIAKTNVTTASGSNGTATANVSGGVSPYSYSWNTVPVKSTQTATGLIAGTYTVTVADANGCTKTATVLITQPTARMADGTQSNVASKSVVFPNPSTGKFTVSFDETIRTEVNLEVMSMTGERVFIKDFDVSEQSNSFNIDLGTLPKGIYFIRYRTNEKDWIDKLVIR